MYGAIAASLCQDCYVMSVGCVQGHARGSRSRRHDQGQGLGSGILSEGSRAYAEGFLCLEVVVADPEQGRRRALPAARGEAVEGWPARVYAVARLDRLRLEEEDDAVE
jgi:hypothetical protein